MQATPGNFFRAAALGLHVTGVVPEVAREATAPRGRGLGATRPQLRLIVGGAMPTRRSTAA